MFLSQHSVRIDPPAPTHPAPNPHSIHAGSGRDHLLNLTASWRGAVCFSASTPLGSSPPPPHTPPPHPQSKHAGSGRDHLVNLTASWRGAVCFSASTPLGSTPPPHTPRPTHPSPHPQSKHAGSGRDHLVNLTASWRGAVCFSASTPLGSSPYSSSNSATWWFPRTAASVRACVLQRRDGLPSSSTDRAPRREDNKLASCWILAQINLTLCNKKEIDNK